MKSIVLHDYFESAEGGGRLSFELACGLGADLGFGFKLDKHPFFESGAFQGREYRLSVLSRLPIWRQLRLASGFSRNSEFLKSYDTVVYSGFYSPLAIRHHQGRQNIYYCHTPPRYLYDQRDFFFSLIPRWQRPVLSAFNSYFRPRYERAIREMDVVVANSDNVRKRIRKYLGIHAEIVHPPCDLKKFRWRKQGDFFLSTGRLDPLKRVDLVVKAFQKLPERKLVVVSGGGEFTRIKQLAQGCPNIDVRGWVDEENLQVLLGTCLATIYIPKDEDFGMSPVESMAAGKPVIGVAEGGLLETVVDGETGVLVPADEISVELLSQTINVLSQKAALNMRENCQTRAALFDRDIFLEKMRAIISKTGAR